MSPSRPLRIAVWGGGASVGIAVGVTLAVAGGVWPPVTEPTFVKFLGGLCCLAMLLGYFRSVLDVKTAERSMAATYLQDFLVPFVMAGFLVGGLAWLRTKSV